MTHILIICLVVLISYFRAIKYGGYCIDDEDVRDAKRTPKNKYQKLWWQFRGHKYLDPQFEHLMGIVIHLTNCILMYYAFGHNQVSFMASLLFAVNPAGTQASVWLSGRMYALSAMSVLLMFTLPMLTPLFYIAGTVFAFTSILAPLILLKTWYWWWLFLIPVYWYLHKGGRSTIQRRLAIRTGVEKQWRVQKIIVFFKTIGYYFCVALIPTRLGIYHEFLYSYGLTPEDLKEGERIDKFFWIGLCISYIFITNYFFNYSLAVFGLFWFFLFISQWGNIITMNQFVAERYLYLPLIGMMYTLASVISALPNSEIIFTVFMTYYITRLQFAIPSYNSIDNCVEYNRLNFPGLHVIYTWLGQIYKKRDANFLALEWWLKGWRLRPSDFRLNNNIACMLTDLGFLNDAEDFLKNAEASVIPEQKKAADEFIAYERARIALIRKAKYPNQKGWKVLHGEK